MRSENKVLLKYFVVEDCSFFLFIDVENVICVVYVDDCFFGFGGRGHDTTILLCGPGSSST